MSLTRQSAATARSAFSALLLTLTGLFAAPAPSFADPCSVSSYSGCLTDPDSYQIKFKFNSSVPLTNIVDMWLGPYRYLSNQGNFPANGQVSLPTGSGVIDAGLWYGQSEHYLLALTADATGDHVVVMMNPATAASVTSGVLTLEDMINGNPVDPLYQLAPGQAETLIIDRLRNQPVEWDTDIDQYFRLDSRYPNRLLPELVINAAGTYDIGGKPADFVMVKFSTGTVIGAVSVEIVPVPEPAAWLSLLAGGGLLALRLRSTRRRKSSRGVVCD